MSKDVLILKDIFVMYFCGGKNNYESTFTIPNIMYLLPFLQQFREEGSCFF